MDISTGKTYGSYNEARRAGVAASDIAHVERRLDAGLPIVKFSKGSFKSYRREPADGGAGRGALVRVGRE